MKRRASTILLMASLVVGCKEGVTPARICTTEARAGIQVEVRDAASGMPAADSVTAYAQDGLFVDTLRTFPVVPPQGALTLTGVYERPGVYAVVIMKPGYRDWIHANVVVNKDECHVITVHLDARLERTP